MTQKERGLLVLKTIVLNLRETPGFSAASEKSIINPDFLIEKIDACLELQRPEVLLSEKEKKMYEEIVESLRKAGKII